MIEIIKSNIAHPQYFELIKRLYDHSEPTVNYVTESSAGMDTIRKQGINTIFLHLTEDKNLIGHLGLICVSKEDAYFGFFELADIKYFQLLWQELLIEAKQKGVKKLFGPVNGTVWHPYRLISESTSEPHFMHEPISSIEYFDLFKACSPANTIKYHSAYRTSYDKILEFTKDSLCNLKINKIQIIPESFSTDLLKLIYELSVAIFSSNPGYFNLPFKDFAELCERVDKKNVAIFKVLHNDRPIGFSYNLLSGNVLIMKTIGLLPEWQEKGIGNAIVHEVHKFANVNHFQKVIYALIRTDNRVKYFPKDDAFIFRKYCAFIYLLS